MRRAVLVFSVISVMLLLDYVSGSLQENLGKHRAPGAAAKAICQFQRSPPPPGVTSLPHYTPAPASLLGLRDPGASKPHFRALTALVRPLTHSVVLQPRVIWTGWGVAAGVGRAATAKSGAARCWAVILLHSQLIHSFIHSFIHSVFPLSLFPLVSLSFIL